MNGTCNSTIFLVPTPWGPGEGPKGQISLNLYHKVNFKDFLNQTYCVFSQLKDIKHIRRDFHSVCLGHAPGVGLGGTVGGWGCPKTFFSQVQPELVCEFLT